MSRAQHRRLVLRDEGRRRVTVASRAAGVAGAALAALFGIVFAQHGSAAAKPLHANAPVVRPRPVAPTTPTTTPAPTTTTAPAPRTVAPRSTADSPTTRATVLRPPAQPPTSAQGGGVGSSGGS